MRGERRDSETCCGPLALPAFVIPLTEEKMHKLFYAGLLFYSSPSLSLSLALYLHRKVEGLHSATSLLCALKIEIGQVQEKELMKT